MSRVSTADIAAVAAPRFGSAVNLRKFWLLSLNAMSENDR